MTRTEFDQKRKEEHLFYKEKYISINEGLIKHHNYREVLGCTRLSSNGKWCVFETFRGFDLNADFSVSKLQVFGENGESNAFDHLYKIMKRFTRQYNRDNKLVEKMSKDEFIKRLKEEKITFRNYYISVDEGMIELKKDVISCTRPENGSNWRIFRSEYAKGLDRSWTTVIQKFKKDEEVAFAYFYNMLTNENFRKEHGL